MEEIIANSLFAFSPIAPGQYQATMQLAGNSVIFKGHFPGRPIVPGVLLLEAVRQTAAMALGKKLSLSMVKQIKFKELVLPDEAITIQLTLTQEGTNYRATAQLLGAQSLKAKIIIILEPHLD